MIDTRQQVSATLKDYRGSKDETKPTDCAPGSTFYEWDTTDLYMFDGTTWIKQEA